MPYQYMPGYQPYYQPPMADQLAQLRGAQYQPMPQQMPQVQPQQAQVSGQSMVWVNGEQEAMGYLVAPNSAVALWDSNAPTIYLKQADASGKPSIKVYDLVERNAPTTAPAAPPAARWAACTKCKKHQAPWLYTGAHKKVISEITIMASVRRGW